VLFCFCKSYTKPYLKKYQEFEDGPSEKKVVFFMSISNDNTFEQLFTLTLVLN